MKHTHYPARPSRTDGGREGLDPYRPGCRARCHACTKLIRFVEGYEMRRDYWTRVPEPGFHQYERTANGSCGICAIGAAKGKHA